MQFDAPALVIKSSYRTMMQKMRLHPDLGGDAGDAQLLNQALGTLLDPKKRAVYDQWLRKYHPESCKLGRRSNESPEHVVEPPKPSATPDLNTKSSAVKLVLCAFCQTENHRPDLHNKNWANHTPSCRHCEAPLSEVESVELSTADDLRRLYRHVLHTRCEIQLSADSVKKLSAQVMDFSVLGLSVQHRGQILEGSCVLIKSQKFVCVARVSYSINKPEGQVLSGMEFLTLDLTMPRGDLFTARY